MLTLLLGNIRPQRNAGKWAIINGLALLHVDSYKSQEYTLTAPTLVFNLDLFVSSTNPVLIKNLWDHFEGWLNTIIPCSVYYN